MIGPPFCVLDRLELAGWLDPLPLLCPFCAVSCFWCQETQR